MPRSPAPETSVQVKAPFDPAEFGLGDRFPATTYAPASDSEIAKRLRACDAEGKAVVLFGGGTLQGLGHLPERYDVALSMRRLDKVLAYEARDLTIAVQAGCTLANLERVLAAQGQFVPLDAPFAAGATVGGTLASGWLGPRRATYGRPRDFVIGTTVALTDGTVAKAGGMVVKNSTGYDISKLYLGSLGTLGAILRANFKTIPIPAARRLAVASLPEGTRARAIANTCALQLEPAAALVVQGFPDEIDGRDGVDGRILILYEGSERLVDRATRELRSALGSAGVPETRLIDNGTGAAFARVIDAYVQPLGARSATYRSGGYPTDAANRLESFARVARVSGLALETIEDLRTGDAIARLSADTDATFADRISGFDAERRTALSGARVISAPAAVRGRLDAWGAPPASLATMKAVKARFDPNRTLAPGRLVGGI
jgi:glycolate oxidase FAD binding subunit